MEHLKKLFYWEPEMIGVLYGFYAIMAFCLGCWGIFLFFRLISIMLENLYDSLNIFFFIIIPISLIGGIIYAVWRIVKYKKHNP